MAKSDEVMRMPLEAADSTTWEGLVTAARAFTLAPLSSSWGHLERAALLRAAHRLRSTGERMPNDVVTLLCQLADNPD